MKILYIHNNYANDNSGEEHAAEAIAGLVEKNGQIVQWYRRSSAELNKSIIKKGLAFFTGLWNPVAVKQLRQKLHEFKPDVVQVQNVYPLISPAIFKTIKKANIPIVMRCPNYRLFCPNGLHLDNKGRICEKCLSMGREVHCILKNCENNWFKSIGYALRNFAARKIWNIKEYVDVFIVQSEFQKQKFKTNGIPDHKIAIVPGLTPNIPKYNKNKTGDLVSFVGRVSLEKGIMEFIEAARQLPEIQFIVAGSVSPDLMNTIKNSPKNVRWTGFLKGGELDKMYHDSRIIVIPGKWYEGFPNVITRAMKHGKPVITSNIGAMASIINHKKNGLLVKPGNAKELAKAINYLYKNPSLCKQYGENGRLIADDNYSIDKIYQKLMNIYNFVISK